MLFKNGLNFYHLIELYKLLWAQPKEEKNKFYKRKYEYYEFFNRVVVVIISLFSFTYLYSDMQLNHGDIFPTLIPRLSVAIPLILYIILTKVITNFRIKVLLNYLQIHCILLATIWSVFHLEDKSHFAEGSFTINMIFLMIGFSSKGIDGLISYIFYFLEIILTNMIIHYGNYGVILSLNIPCATGILIAQQILNISFLEHYLMEVELEKSTVTDSLTQVYNRHMLTQILKDNKISEFNTGSSLVMMDIDFFKNINDSYGHFKGDEVLAYLGQVLNHFKNENDTIIRYGGEEFLIFMNDCPLQDAYQRMESLRIQIMESDSFPIKFTISAGITTYDGYFEQSLKLADSLLYQSKENGRNQVTI